MLARFITGRRRRCTAHTRGGRGRSAAPTGLNPSEPSGGSKVSPSTRTRFAKAPKKRPNDQFLSYGCARFLSTYMELFGSRGHHHGYLGHELQAIECRGDLCATPPPPPPLFFEWLNRPLLRSRQLSQPAILCPSPRPRPPGPLLVHRGCPFLAGQYFES